MRRSLAHGEKCILACDKTLTGGTVAAPRRQNASAAPNWTRKYSLSGPAIFIAGKALLRLRFTASAPRQISYRIPLFSAIKYSIIAKKYPHGAISGECAAPFG